jgi:[ribosomal protein S5]-alanine N-acetyltransferase
MTNRIILNTLRLQLVGADVALLRADLTSVDALSATLDTSIAETWPPEYYDAAAVQWMLNATEALVDDAVWRSYYIVLMPPSVERATLVGTAGYKSAPNEHGVVEVGYSIVASFQRQGIASEAVRAIIAQAYVHCAKAVTAETYPHLIASIGVMRRCEMIDEGPGSEEGTVRYVHRLTS